MAEQKLEYWLRGLQVEEVLPQLQHIAQTLLQAEEEITEFVQGLTDEQIRVKPAGCASVGFHLKHIVGFHDRLYTYAVGKPLNEAQFAYLKQEAILSEDEKLDDLMQKFHACIRDSITKIKGLKESELLEKRFVGRNQLPTTQLALITHMAEHTMRHTGQLLVTCRIVKALAQF